MPVDKTPALLIINANTSLYVSYVIFLAHVTKVFDSNIKILLMFLILS